MRKILFCILILVPSFSIFAGSFTPGNIVIVRVGTGGSTLNNQSTRVFLDEYTVSGTFVQTIALPDSAIGSSHALTLSGTAVTEGELTLSANGQYLSMAGFDTMPGYANVSTGITNRTVARIDAAGNVNTTTAFAAGSAFINGNYRGAVSNDGNEFWAYGSGGVSGGIWYIPFGAFSASAVQNSNSQNNVRNANIFGGQVYFTVGGTGMYKDGTGLPATAGQTESELPGFPTHDSTLSPFSFVFLDESPSVPGLDVIYVADNDAFGGIYKYSLVGGNWVTNGNIASANALTGLTGFYSCHGTSLFTSGPSGVWALNDTSGYNHTITGTYTQIVSGAANTLIHGVAFAPGTIMPSVPSLSASATNVQCYGANNGAVATTLSGGYGTPAYNWGSGITTQNRSNLGPGTYSVTVTDALGCTASATATITQPASALAITHDSITNLPCSGGSTGAISISVSGGTGSNYHYHWLPGGQSSQNISGLTAGTYYVSVTDSNNCVVNDSFHVSQSGSLALRDSVVPPSCFASANGSIYVMVSGGNPAYHYHWSLGGDTTAMVQNLNGGSYTITVTDQNGCTLIQSIPVLAPDSLALIINYSDPSTHGGNNGSARVSVSGGTPPYTYLWNPTASTSDSISNLTAGSYCVTVTDLHSCTDHNCVTLTQPNGIEVTGWLTGFKAFQQGNQLNIEISTDQPMPFTLAIFDLNGMLIKEFAGAGAGTQVLQYPVDALADGCYLVKIESAGGIICRKIGLFK